MESSVIPQILVLLNFDSLINGALKINNMDTGLLHGGDFQVQI